MAAMTGLVSVGDLIESRPDYRDGRPFIAGTGVTVGRIGVLWSQGRSVDEIVNAVYEGHLTQAQVHAALATYLANRAQFDADLAAQDEATDRAAETWYAEHPRV